jgi:hypothetical protein
VDTATPTEWDTAEAFQAAGDLAGGQAALLVEFDDGGLGVGSPLGGGSTKSIGRLQRMTALHTAVAGAAFADMDVELPMDRPARDFHLKLLGDVGFVERAAAIGADVG